jgi:HEAT repeat protein
MTSPFEKIIAGLGSTDEPLHNTDLAELSNPGTEDMKVFRAYWPDISPERREQIVERLVELAEESVELNFDAIFRYCLKDESSGVRSKSIEGLWENEETSLITPLIEMLENDVSEDVQAEAAKALGKFTLLAEHGRLRGQHAEKVQEALLSAIGDERKSAEVNRRALEAIAPVSLPEVREAIADAYKSGNRVLKASAIFAMGKSCDPVWMPVLLSELASKDAEMRYEAAGACGELEQEEAVPSLINTVNDDEDIDVRIAAVQSLGRIGNAPARECLKHFLESNSEAIRQAAEQALNEIEVSEDPLTFGKWKLETQDN